MKRKTIEIEKLKIEANRMMALDNSRWMNNDIKQGIARLIEYALHETDNYSGFNYNEWLNRGGCEKWRKENDEANKSYNTIVDPEKYPQHYTLVNTVPFLGDEYDRFYY